MNYFPLILSSVDGYGMISAGWLHRSTDGDGVMALTWRYTWVGKKGTGEVKLKDMGGLSYDEREIKKRKRDGV